MLSLLSSLPFSLPAAGGGLALQPVPSPSGNASDVFDFHTRESDKYKHVYTSYLCLEAEHNNHGACTHSDGTNAADGKLHRLLANTPNDFHLLVYGSSYIRQLADALIRDDYDGSKGSPDVHVHGEQDNSKTCFCSLDHHKCPCADYATYRLRGERRLTVVVNYEHMQTPHRLGNLHDLLHDKDGSRFTHALVMEPHEPCFFRESHGDGGSASCAAEAHGDTYGCGWSEQMWEKFGSRFGLDSGKMVHVVPWGVPEGFDHVAHEHIALRTRQIAMTHACETKIDPNHPIDRPATASAKVSQEHQCFAVCDRSQEHCRTGSPSIMAAAAVEMLRHRGE